MSITKEEIELREQIANEIQNYINNSNTNFNQDYVEGIARAIGVVREKIWHGKTCPCTRCEGRKLTEEYYTVSGRTILRACCNEVQFVYTCKKHQEEMGCHFCSGFDYKKPCNCEE